MLLSMFQVECNSFSDCGFSVLHIANCISLGLFRKTECKTTGFRLLVIDILIQRAISELQNSCKHYHSRQFTIIVESVRKVYHTDI